MTRRQETTLDSAADPAEEVTAARAGDRDAFGALFDRYHHELQVHCYRLLGSYLEAEDLLQETFERAWRSLGRFKGDSSLRAWLYRIATNACLDALRQQGRRRVLPFDVMEPVRPGGPLPEAAGAADEREVLERYVDAHLSGDVEAMAEVLADDVRIAYPQIPLWSDSIPTAAQGGPDAEEDAMSGYDQSQPPTPAADLRALGERLLGTWRHQGGAEGTVRFEWLEGGFFLAQHVGLEQFGQRIKGIELIGHLRPFGQPPEEAIRSRFYDNTGNTLDYVYELEGDDLTIWGGEKGSPAYFKGTFSPDGTTLAGAWSYPGGGGYEVSSTRVED